jgi:hypothetical protein
VFLSPTGDTVFYRRRASGWDTLYAFKPDDARTEQHQEIAASQAQLRAWPGPGGLLAVCEHWPRAAEGLRFKLFDTARVSRLLNKPGQDANLLLTDVPEVADFRPEPDALPMPLFERLGGAKLVVPGVGFVSASRQAPALYVLDGAGAGKYLVPLPFLADTALPSGLYTQPDGRRHWLTVGDSNHLFVLDADSHEMAGDVVWPVEEKALARVAFHPLRPEAWISAHSSVFVYALDTLELLSEIAIERELRWHKGERVIGLIGGCAFSRDGARALVARPMSGDLLEIDAARRKVKGSLPVAIDALDLLYAPIANRLYMQSLRNGNISWLPYH